MDWVEDRVDTCKDVCGDHCPAKDVDMCDEVDGDRHMLDLMENWGYAPLLPSQLPAFPPVHRAFHFAVGLIILLAGVLGTVSHASLITIHLRLREYLMDPTGILLFNFLAANLGMCILQFPFSSSSSFAASWLWGELGCQLYAAVGFFFGIGVIYALGVLIIDRYLRIAHGYQHKGNSRLHWILILVSWHSILLFAAPPLLDVFGRYGLEPSGTMCTLDFWHGNFRNYNTYVFYLVTFAFAIPVCTMLFMFLKSAHYIQDTEVTKKWSVVQLEHQTALTKVCGQLFITQMVCWTPYAVLVLWTVVFPPTSLNIYLTLLPPIVCKVAPVVNAAIVWWNLPRVQVAHRYLQGGKQGAPPPELGCMATVGEEAEQEEKMSLTPAVG